MTSRNLFDPAPRLGGLEERDILMKFNVVLGVLLNAVWVTGSHAQGTVRFDNDVPGAVVTHVYTAFGPGNLERPQ